VLKLLRNGEAKTFTVTLGELPNDVARDEISPNSNSAPDKSRTDALTGVAVANLEQSVRQQLDVPNNVQGALVYELDRNSNSAEAGLQIGDLIVEINRQPVRNAEDAKRLGRQAKGSQILLKIWRHEGSFAGTRFLSVDNTRIGK
jgi:serine protease Do